MKGLEHEWGEQLSKRESTSKMRLLEMREGSLARLAWGAAMVLVHTQSLLSLGVNLLLNLEGYGREGREL